MNRVTVTGTRSFEQDLATQWLQAYPCKANTSQETTQKFFESKASPESALHRKCTGTWRSLRRSPVGSFYVNAPSFRDKWYFRKSRKQGEKKAPPRYFCNPACMKNWWPDSIACNCYLRNVQDLFIGRDMSIRTALWRTILWANCSFWMTHFPKVPKLRSMQADGNHKRALQKTHKRPHTPHRKDW